MDTRRHLAGKSMSEISHKVIGSAWWDGKMEVYLHSDRPKQELLDKLKRSLERKFRGLTFDVYARGPIVAAAFHLYDKEVVIKARKK